MSKESNCKSSFYLCSMKTCWNGSSEDGFSLKQWNTKIPSNLHEHLMKFYILNTTMPCFTMCIYVFKSKANNSQWYYVYVHTHIHRSKLSPMEHTTNVATWYPFYALFIPMHFRIHRVLPPHQIFHIEMSIFNVVWAFISIFQMMKYLYVACCNCISFH